jgi:hypothetical protein
MIKSSFDFEDHSEKATISCGFPLRTLYQIKVEIARGLGKFVGDFFGEPMRGAEPSQAAERATE